VAPIRTTTIGCSTCLSLLLLSVAGCASYDPDAPWTAVGDRQAARFQAAVEGARAEQDLPGLAMAVAYRHSHQVWAGATGMAELDPDVAWQPSSRSRIGSVTKTFTTAAVFQLVEEGAITLDDPIERWVPGWYEGPTVRHLLGHSSGIVSYNYVGSFDGSRPWTPEELVQWAWDNERTLRFEPGTDWEYSNTNYVLLGLLIESVTGQDYGTVLESRFIDPLALADTRLALTGDSDPRLVRCYTGAPPDDITDRDDPSMGWAAGGMVSTPEDLARWSASLFGGEVLSAESHALMVTPGGLTGDDESEYGLGAFYEGDDQDVIDGHTGGIGGYLTYAYYLEDPGVALVVMANQEGTDLRAASTWGWAAVLGVRYP
jgi:D-alanyl-D-alanine carboxypeptidase